MWVNNLFNEANSILTFTTSTGQLQCLGRAQSIGLVYLKIKIDIPGKSLAVPYTYTPLEVTH